MAQKFGTLKPQLIVFDLDYTLWPFWVDTHVDPPFNKRSDGKVYDGHGRQVKYYRDVPEILKRLQSEGYKLAVASRTPCTEEARSILHLFDWNQYFTYKEIYPGTKTNHFKRFKEQSNIPYSEMLFFDDEYRNIVDLNSIGVTSIHVEDGVTEQVVKEGLRQFEENIKKRRRTDL